MDDLYSVLEVSVDATSAELRTAYLEKIRRVHPDVEGGNEEWAKQITAAYQVLSDPQERERYDRNRDAGSCPYCGTDVRGRANLEAHLLLHLAQESAEACRLCGRHPTDVFTFRSNAGFLLARQVWGFEGRLCSSCARGMYREFQARNITRGPWGFISLFASIWYLIANTSSYRSVELPPPQPADPLADEALQGRPVLARGAVWLSLAIIGFLLVNVLSSITPSSTAGRTASSSTSPTAPQPDWVVGTCVDFVGGSASPVWCSDNRADGRIVSVVSSSTNCPISAEWYVEVSALRVACIMER